MAYFLRPILLAFVLQCSELLRSAVSEVSVEPTTHSTSFQTTLSQTTQTTSNSKKEEAVGTNSEALNSSTNAVTPNTEATSRSSEKTRLYTETTNTEAKSTSTKAASRETTSKSSTYLPSTNKLDETKFPRHSTTKPSNKVTTTDVPATTGLTSKNVRFNILLLSSVVSLPIFLL
ncbi:hypothetical protein AHF37_05154 [Paragonimus kellicotti]|nr:hypothetical protein AHF37_05154 [Paragonimus kellicotti]